MKMLVVTSLKEYQPKVASILGEAGITAFSVTDTVGYKMIKQPALEEGWFGYGRGKFNSVFFFSFSGDEETQKAMELIRSCNLEKQERFPVKGFVVEVEAFT